MTKSTILLKVLFLLSSAIMILGCSRTSVIPEEEKAIPETQSGYLDDQSPISRKDLTKLPNLVDYKEALSEIPPELKLRFWTEKMEENKKYFSDKTKQDFIGSLKNRLSLKIFSNGLSDIEEEEIYIEALSLFSEEETFRLFFVLHDFGSPLPPLGPIGSSGECECRYSIWCGFGPRCDKGSCNASYNCGIFGTSRCRGVCENTMW